MTENPDDEQITLVLDRHEALVMLEWLDQVEDPDDAEDLAPFESAVFRLRRDLECMLESPHPDVFASDYESRLEAAIEEVRDDFTYRD